MFIELLTCQALFQMWSRQVNKIDQASGFVEVKIPVETDNIHVLLVLDV